MSKQEAVFLAPRLGGFVRVHVAALIGVWLAAGAKGAIRGSVLRKGGVA